MELIVAVEVIKVYKHNTHMFNEHDLSLIHIKCLFPNYFDLIAMIAVFSE